MEEKPVKKHASSFSILGPALHIGFFIVFSVLIFVLAGLWLDKKFETLPLFLILGVIASLAVSMVEVYRIIRSLK